AASLVAIAASAAALTFWMRARRADDRPRPHFRFALMLPESASVNVSQRGTSFALSPDGKKLAYAGGPGANLYVRDLDELTPRLVSNERIASPRFSPDGAWIGYVAGNMLRT